ncbi:hypothetical protein RN001_013919 [Aquatica leii]|uniref:Uncharacterized protein n=1 Tax=Aquatica leii TaxID=1421715 RepID=A0AAN7SE76_9COLE|nr:hypothetical protein RN001_013919 [Aquatica leii]
METLTKLVLCIILYSCCKETFARSTQRTYLDPTDPLCYSKDNENLLVYDENGFVIEENEKVNELMRCQWEKNGVLCENGIDFYKLQRMLEAHLTGHYNNYIRTYLASKTIEDCYNVKGKNNGDTCVKLYNCLQKRLAANLKLLEDEAE